MSRKEIQLKKSEKCKWQIGGAQMANWRKGENQLHSRTTAPPFSYSRYSYPCVMLLQYTPTPAPHHHQHLHICLQLPQQRPRPDAHNNYHHILKSTYNLKQS